MIECHQLTPYTAWGADAVPFLVRMARTTLQAGHQVVIPYPLAATEDGGGVEIDVDMAMDGEGYVDRGGGLPRGVA